MSSKEICDICGRRVNRVIKYSKFNYCEICVDIVKYYFETASISKNTIDKIRQLNDEELAMVLIGLVNNTK